ncbi:hypothetical protein [Geothrix sp. 21YS21S-2]|uniref:hypothetical protein n=1 Tax=Geothrix sp. 21YS21S-2 TaxID=3068893 RepID=UPI0027BA166C|nr:hypothetical protein [Geothrix sp. 21YS21S-2]
MLLAVTQTLGACGDGVSCPLADMTRSAADASNSALDAIPKRRVEVGNMQGTPSNGLYYLAVCLTCRLGSAITTDPAVCLQWGQFHSANNPNHNVVLRSASNPAVLAP